MNEQFSISGLDELKADLEKAVRLYPDKAMEMLEKSGKQFKNRVIRITHEATEHHTGNLAKGYKVDQVQGFGANMQVNFRATAKHFHLIENGHEMVVGRVKKGRHIIKEGKVVGYVPGRLIVHQVREEYRTKLPKNMREMLEEILRESDL